MDNFTQNTSSTGAPPARRLYKSRTHRMIDGVCGGVSEYFEVDPTIVRVLWVLFTLLGGAGFILYIVGMVIMPANPNQFYTLYPNDATPDTAGVVEQNAHKKNESRRFWGIVLVLIGALVLMSNLGWFANINWFSLSWEVVFPAILIAVGLWLLYVQTQGRTQSPAQGMNAAPGQPGVEPSAGADTSQALPDLQRLRSRIPA